MNLERQRLSVVLAHLPKHPYHNCDGAQEMTLQKEKNRECRPQVFIFSDWVVFTISPLAIPPPSALPFLISYGHKVLIYIEHHSVCPLVGIGTPPPLQPQASVPSPRTKGWGGHTRLRLKGWGSPNSNDWRNAQHSAYSVHTDISLISDCTM